MTWASEDVERVARELSAKGVTFEHYHLPGTTVEGAVHVEDDRKGGVQDTSPTRFRADQRDNSRLAQHSGMSPEAYCERLWPQCRRGQYGGRPRRNRSAVA